ncbi:unnamed protein product, partial [Polarella glacialis]
MFDFDNLSDAEEDAQAAEELWSWLIVPLGYQFIPDFRELFEVLDLELIDGDILSGLGYVVQDSVDSRTDPLVLAELRLFLGATQIREKPPESSSCSSSSPAYPSLPGTVKAAQSCSDHAVKRAKYVDFRDHFAEEQEVSMVEVQSATAEPLAEAFCPDLGVLPESSSCSSSSPAYPSVPDTVKAEEQEASVVAVEAATAEPLAEAFCPDLGMLPESSSCSSSSPAYPSLPGTVKAADVVSTSSLTISEFFGTSSSGHSQLSACLAMASADGGEAYQTPEFDTYVMVTAGEIQLVRDDMKGSVKQGEGVLLKAGQRVLWIWDRPSQYVIICLPAGEAKVTRETGVQAEPPAAQEAE